jgi:predicted dehydrogenase
LDSARVVAVSDLNETLAKSTASQWRIPRYYLSLSKLIEVEKIDIVDLCTPPQTHASLAVEAMKAGINVIIEKPMTMSASDAERIVNCQKDTKMKVGVIHNWLFEPPVLKAISIAKKGYLGEIINLEIEALSPKNDSMAASEHHWCHAFPGGRFSEMLAHPIYLTRQFIGERIEVGDVQVSKLGDYAWMKSDELCGTLTAGRKIGRLYDSFNAPRNAIFLSLYGRDAILKLDVINATINVLPRRRTTRFSKAFDSIRQATQLMQSTVKNAATVISGRWLSGHDLYIRLFVESLVNNSEPPVTAFDGLEVIRILEKICTRISEAEKKLGEP